MTRFALLVPTAVFAADNQAAGGSPTPTFLASVAAGNLFEIESSKLALDLTKSDRVKDGGPEPISTPISQETLAEIIGTTRSRVSQFMNKFKKLGFIEYNGHLEIHSSLLSVLLRE
jgi:hypothetical protein